MALAHRRAFVTGLRYSAGMSCAYPHDWLIPDWPAPPWVKAVFTTRAGGVSLAPYDSFNLGDHVQDEAQAVQHNRIRLAQATGAQPVFLQQVHGVQVAALDSLPSLQPPLQADACWSTTAGLGCTVMVADCLPVLVTHRRLPIVGAAHAGWRGLAGAAGVGVLETLLQTLRQQILHLPDTASGDDADWMAWLGPCIGPAAFEVGDEVRTIFVQQLPEAERCFVAGAQPGKWLANLPMLARQRLQAAGVQEVHGNDGSQPWCTWSNPQQFFSYRRQLRTGRMAAMIWLSL